MKRVGKWVGNFIPAALLPDLLLTLSLLVFLVLLRTLAPQQPYPAQPATPAAPTQLEQVPAAPRAAGEFALQPPRALSTDAAPASSGRPFVTKGDTINGEFIDDPVLVQRIERLAAAIPPGLLAGTPRVSGVRYLAHGFDAGDDASISYGLFRDPAAALAFGCAIDEHLLADCGLVPVTGPRGFHEDPPGVQCQPLGLALGAAAYEPDRCEASG